MGVVDPLFPGPRVPFAVIIVSLADPRLCDGREGHQAGYCNSQRKILLFHDYAPLKNIQFKREKCTLGVSALQGRFDVG